VDKYKRLLAAVSAVYYAAHWTPDRPCNAAQLWIELRDAAGFVSGKAPKPLQDYLNNQEGKPTDKLEREWTDISNEEYRVYEFPGKDKIHIDKPKQLHVSASGGHRVLDADGISHYIPSGWLHLFWRGDPAFVK